MKHMPVMARSNKEEVPPVYGESLNQGYMAAPPGCSADPMPEALVYDQQKELHSVAPAFGQRCSL